MGASVWLAGLLALLAASGESWAGAGDWPGFRGAGDSVVAEPLASGLPWVWSDTNQVAWRVALAGAGQSSPVVWKGRVYVTGAKGARKETWVVQALDAGTGREVWRHERASLRPEEVSDTRSLAAPTPVAGEDGVYAVFESGECVALDHDGRVRWHRALFEEVGEFAGNHGLGGSPALAGGMLVVPLDQERPSCLMGLDGGTGETRWKAARPGRTGWSSALVVGEGTGAQVVMSTGGAVVSYEASTGKVVWELGGFVRNLVPSPTYRDGLLVVGAGGKGSNGGYAWGGKEAVPVERWRADDVSSGFASPLVHRGRVYFVGTAGVVHAREAGTGRVLFDERMGQSVWASPVGAGDRVYFFGDRGRTTVIAAEDGYRPLGTNELSLDGKVVGVAVVGGGFLVRTPGQLVRVGGVVLPAAP